MTEPSPSPGVRPSRRRKPPRAPLLVLLILLVLAVAVGAYYLVSRPALVLANGLAGPIRVVLDSGVARVVAPGESVRMTGSRGKTLVAMWEMVRPLSADKRPMGEEVRGSVVVPEPQGTIYRRAAPSGAHGDYFAPLITNASDELLRVKVNAGLEGALDCGCAVRQGARRVFIGYYRFYRNSTVEARAGEGRTATFRDLGSSVVSPDGAIGLRFDSRDFASQPATP